MIRRDRDRSRDFLADVSHELRTRIAALRTFNELLKGRAGADSDARAEFLESGGQQIERLDWLATNLLELSKLDSDSSCSSCGRTTSAPPSNRPRSRPWTARTQARRPAHPPAPGSTAPDPA